MSRELQPHNMDRMVSLQNVGISALRNAGKVHDSLGESGKEKISNNQFGQLALRVDVECEEAVINTVQENNISMVIVSEEHGKVEVGKSPQMLGVLDGLDGTNRYVAGRGVERYGTMFGFYEGTDPKYSDYIFGGILVHSTGQLFYATRGLGAFVEKDGERTQIKTTDTTELTAGKTRLLADTLYDEEYGIDVITSKLRKFEGYDIKCLRATCIHMAELVNGDVDSVIESTRKGNLEIGAAFAIINEAGGVALDINGTDLSNEKFLSFNQDRNVPIVYAANKKLAERIISRMTI